MIELMKSALLDMPQWVFQMFWVASMIAVIYIPIKLLLFTIEERRKDNIVRRQQELNRSQNFKKKNGSLIRKVFIDH